MEQQITDVAASDLRNIAKGLFSSLQKTIISQEQLLQRLVIAVLCDGHLLVEGAPGLAKTRAIKNLAKLIEGSFQRIQFTPDLLPADITGTEIYKAQDGSFTFEQGPIFNNIILADEVNRAPAKLQSALLEAMAERQVTIGKKTYQLPELFLVMATQNPLEQEGTYPLPEAQLDRFLLHVNVDYPAESAELEILRCVHQENLGKFLEPCQQDVCITQQQIFMMRRQVLQVHLNENLEKYIVRLVAATRKPGNYSSTLAEMIEYGASPRAALALAYTARAHAWLDGRDYVIPDDIKSLAHDVLRHRIIFSFAAQASSVTPDECISEILRFIAIP